MIEPANVIIRILRTEASFHISLVITAGMGFAWEPALIASECYLHNTLLVYPVITCFHRRLKLLFSVMY